MISLLNFQRFLESPFRLEITPRDCKAETGDSLKEPDETGNCVCQTNSLKIGSNCVESAVIVPAILVPFIVVVALVVAFCIVRKRQKMDSLWKVHPDDLRIDPNPEILGRGRFGLVVLGEYRGTQVAVKRVLHSSEGTTKSKNTSSGGRFIPLAARSKKEQPSAGKTASASCNEPSTGSHTDEEMGITTGFYLATSQSRTTGTLSGDYSNVATTARVGTKAAKSSFMKEMRLLSQLRHPCITTVMGAVILPHDESMLILEYMELGSLRDVLRSSTMAVDDAMVLSMVQDVAKGVRFLHAANPQVVHGDIKAQNVLVDSNFRAKVADFGLSRRHRFAGAASGTPFWMAPELLRGESGNTTMSDIYSFGILLYEAYARAYPYVGEETNEVLRLVADEKVMKRPPIPARCPPEVAEIMQSCLLNGPTDRPTADEVDAKFTSASQSGNKTQVLWQLFPRHVAAALREGRKVEPETHEEVTVYICEIMNLSSLGNDMPRQKVAHLLDRLHSKFDNLCDLHNVFRIETGSETFMCVTNLAEKQHEHVRIMASFATDTLKAAACTLVDDDDPSKGYVRINVGFHTGNVVSHVVGSKTPRFSIIGETVQITEKIMASSEGRLQCSDVSAALLQEQDPDAELFLRGENNVAGVDGMITYWVGEPIVLGSEPVVPTGQGQEDDADMGALIEWNVDVLHRILRDIAAARDTSKAEEGPSDFSRVLSSIQGQTVFDEVKEVVELPPFDAETVRRVKERKDVSIPTNVLAQLRHFVTAISQTYDKEVPFHNFQVSRLLFYCSWCLHYWLKCSMN
jgi:guanylate cyclase